MLYILKQNIYFAIATQDRRNHRTISQNSHLRLLLRYYFETTLKTVFGLWTYNLWIHRRLTGQPIGWNFILLRILSLFTAMSRGKETSSCAAALLLCTVLALPAPTGEAENTQAACALQCTREVPSQGINGAKCKLPADMQNLKCSHQQLLELLRNVSILWVRLRLILNSHW